MSFLTIKWLHVLSSTVLFGTGLGSAYYLFFISRGRDARAVAAVAHYLVIADTLFTATTAVFQPLSGWYLAHLAGLSMFSGWLGISLLLYALAIVCWLPVGWLQIRMRDLAEAAAHASEALPPEYGRLLKLWTALGVPAFIAFVAIFWLMVHKPA